jgi:hypothetical protein
MDLVAHPRPITVPDEMSRERNGEWDGPERRGWKSLVTATGSS